LAARAEEPRDYVVATGESRSVRDLVATAFAHVGILDWEHLVHSEPDRARPIDPPDLTGDATLARTVLGWAPTLDFAGIVGRMVDADLDRVGRPAVGSEAQAPPSRPSR